MSTEEGPAARKADDDHDLLTFGEVDARLREEIAAARALVTRLTADGTGQAADAAQTRLVALEEAHGRNSRQPINDDNFERFFGFKGAFASRGAPLKPADGPLEARPEDVTNNSLD